MTARTKHGRPSAIKRTMAQLTLTLVALNMAEVQAAHIPLLFKQCYPCTAYGFYYCQDDPNLVNLNGDKCYSSIDDKPTYCNDFNFFSNPLLCDEVSLDESALCDAIFGPENMQYYTHLQSSITLAPRSSCGFFLYEYSAYLDIYHQYPMSLYHRDYKTVKYSDTDYIVKQSDDTGTLPGNSCYN